MTAINGPLADAIGLAILHLLWQGTAVALGLAFVLRLLARSTANVRYALSCLALAALLIFGITTAVQSYDVELAAIAAVAPAPAAFAIDSPVLLRGHEPRRAVASFLTLLRPHSSTIATLWLMGVLLFATRLAVTWTRTRSLAFAGATAVAAEWQRVVDRLANALAINRAIRLAESTAVGVPSVIGFLKPVILVPASSLSGLSARQMELILAHELAHIRRHDFIANMLQSVAEALLFYHPAAWWISHQIRTERENCCDDLAVSTCGNPLEYARALTVLEQLRSTPALVIGANGASLLARVRRLIGHREQKLANGWTAIAAAVTFAVIIMIASVPVHADRDEPRPPHPPSTEIEVVAPAPPAPPAKRSPRVVAPPDMPQVPDMQMTESPLAALPPPDAAMAIAATEIHDEDEGQETASSTSPATGRLTIDELISLRTYGITPQYIEQMRSLFGPLTIKEISKLRLMDVSRNYVADLRAAGVDVNTWKEALSLRTHNVTPAFVRAMAAAGYANLSVRDLVRLALAGVDAEFIRKMQKYRDKNAM